MPGKRITDQQVAIYMNNRKDRKTQAFSAAKAGFSKRRGHDIEHGKRMIKRERTHRTRPDDFKEVFESVIVPLLEKGARGALFFIKHLQKLYPGKYPNSKMRTLRRRIEEWNLLHGKGKEVMFLQEHVPGELAVCDFTLPDNITITIKGEPFEHNFFHLRLAYSGFSYVQVYGGKGESFEKFADGLNASLFFIGGLPKVLRTDSLSAAFKNLHKKAKEDLTKRFQALIEHYGIEATRINCGKSHENGSIESPHGHFKRALKNSLIVRGSYDFASIEAYQSFVLEVVNERNEDAKGLFEIERLALQPLPQTKALAYSEATAVVACTSTIEVKRVTYTVPSNFIGKRLQVRIYPERLECYFGRNHVVSLLRVIASKKKRMKSINYKHVIGSLIQKPHAFYGCKYRDDLLPNDQYKYIWSYVDKVMERSAACKFMVGLLHLAATQNCEEKVARVVLDQITRKEELNLKNLQDTFIPKRELIPKFPVIQHALHSYNSLIKGAYYA